MTDFEFDQQAQEWADMMSDMQDTIDAMCHSIDRQCR